MAKNIERYLFKSDGQHGLAKLTFSEFKIGISVVPWGKGGQTKSYVFDKCKLSSLATCPDANAELEFPWEIIAVDAKEQNDNKWFFCIHCDSAELNFVAEWPKEISKVISL